MFFVYYMGFVSPMTYVWLLFLIVGIVMTIRDFRRNSAWISLIIGPAVAFVIMLFGATECVQIIIMLIITLVSRYLLIRQDTR